MLIVETAIDYIKKNIKGFIEKGKEKMREIKFRAFDVENKEMLEVENLYFNEITKKVEIKTTMYSDYFDTEEMELMQYTRTKR